MSQNINLQQIMNSAGLAVRQSREAMQLAQSMGGEVGQLRGQLQELARNASELRQTLQKVSIARAGGGDPGIQRVENIPGRRVPFDLLVSIPIGANVTAVQQGTLTISQDGPFVAVARYASFLSAYSYQLRSPVDGSVATFSGRSFGRWRPIHSAWDLNDGQPANSVSYAQPFPGTGAPHVISPSNQSSFRSMEADFNIFFQDAGSSFPRSNIEVPSSFYTKAVNDPFELGALDVFERGEVITWKVLPLHVNNPSFGNVSGFGAPNANYPFLDSGFDAVEGVVDQNDAAAADLDPITRVPNGFLVIGFHGYRIIQPAGAGQH
jgi:hypothetical protein